MKIYGRMDSVRYQLHHQFNLSSQENEEDHEFGVKIYKLVFVLLLNNLEREAENDPLPTQTETTPNPYGILFFIQ